MLDVQNTCYILKNRLIMYKMDLKLNLIPLNFINLLSDNFIQLDGYWLLEDQVKEYNKWKSRFKFGST